MKYLEKPYKHSWNTSSEHKSGKWSSIFIGIVTAYNKYISGDTTEYGMVNNNALGPNIEQHPMIIGVKGMLRKKEKPLFLMKQRL